MQFLIWFPRFAAATLHARLLQHNLIEKRENAAVQTKGFNAKRYMYIIIALCVLSAIN